MNIGDYVEITRPDAGEKGFRGTITKHRVGTEWYVALDDLDHELSWLERSMTLIATRAEIEAEAIRVLGEEYFE